MGSLIVLFDGVCNFCDGSVHFLIARDPKQQFRFAALQSESGQKILAKFGLPSDALDTMVVVEGDRIYQKSSAALRVVRRLPGLWRVLYLAVVIPRPIRDWAYDYFAAHRYRWFGKLDACPAPTPELRARFLT